MSVVDSVDSSTHLAPPVTPKKKDKIHSITFYIPKSKVPFYSESLKVLAKLTHGSDTSTGKVSKYLRSLIDQDFKERGLLGVTGEPNPEALEDLKAKLGTPA